MVRVEDRSCSLWNGNVKGCKHHAHSGMVKVRIEDRSCSLWNGEGKD